MTAVLVILAIAAYFLPSIVGATRDCKGGGIFIVNLLLGWTVIGWLVAFVWACAGRTNKDDHLAPQRHAELIAALRGAPVVESKSDMSRWPKQDIEAWHRAHPQASDVSHNSSAMSRDYWAAIDRLASTKQ